MAILSRWLAPAVIVAGLGFGALAPAPVQAQDDVLTRVLVDIADVVFNNGVPYYRYGHYGYDDRLVVGRDRKTGSRKCAGIADGSAESSGCGDNGWRIIRLNTSVFAVHSSDLARW